MVADHRAGSERSSRSGVQHCARRCGRQHLCRARLQDAAARSREPGEVLQASDVPAGVVNVLTGWRRASWPSSSRRTWTSTQSSAAMRSADTARRAQVAAADNIKRVDAARWARLTSEDSQSPVPDPRHAGNQDDLAPHRRLSRSHQRMFRLSSRGRRVLAGSAAARHRARSIGRRRSRISNRTSSSSRASCAPRQKCHTGAER